MRLLKLLNPLAVIFGALALLAVAMQPSGLYKHWLFSGKIPFVTLQAQYSTGQFLAPCYGVASGNSTGTNGETTAGASGTPVWQIATSVTGTNTHNYVCDVSPPSRTTGTTGIGITQMDFLYGVQTAALGTQVAVLASGTFNGTIAFATIAVPTPGAGETPSAVTPVRADTGSITFTPVVGSFNVSTTTAGAFVTERVIPSAVVITNTLSKYYLSMFLQNTATTATTTNSPGVIVYTQ